MRDAFVQVDMEGKIIEFNNIFCKMLQYSPEEIHHLTYRDLTPENWHTYEQSIVKEQIIPMGYSQVYEKEYRRKDGTVFPVELRTILSSDENGNPVSMWAIVRDITERKLAELKLKQQAEELKELNALKDKFFSILAHDLKNPFTILLGSSELMIDQLDKGELESTKKLASIINKSAKNGLQLLVDLMEWSKVQTGIVKFNPQKINLKAEIEKIAEKLDLVAKNKKIGLKSEITEDMEVIADRYMLNTILRNLLENAIKFTSECGSIRVMAKKRKEFCKCISKRYRGGYFNRKYSQAF
ncbi:MAG: PAS domain S-box protein [Bacteroidales bacterium]|nr:PAS domain S-box protein [Bacteroidales bacterium]